MQQLSYEVKQDMGGPIKTWRCDVKCVKLNQNYYIICLPETLKEKNMRLKKKQLFPEIVKLDDGHEIVVVHDHEGRNLLMQTSVPEKPLGDNLTPIDENRQLALSRQENGKLNAWIETS
jgi:hypothetical protein